MEALRLEKLEKEFIDGLEKIRVLRGVDLNVKQGDFVSITGKSGTGKSTLIYQMGLLDHPTNGKVFIEGKDSSSFSMKERTECRLFNFGFVFQDYALMPELNAWENIALPVLMRGVSKEEARRRAVEILDTLGMKDKARNVPSKLSGGEAQRVSIGRAIVHKPKILFADEPTANLDTERSRQIIDIFHELHRQGQTIIMVTHELDYAEEAARVLVVEEGVTREKNRYNDYV